VVFYLALKPTRHKMVLSKILGNSKKQDESLEDIESKIESKQSKIQSIRGEQQLQDLKQKKRKQLKQKNKELKKKEFEQTKAGQLLGSLSNSLESLSNNIDGSSQQEERTKQSLQNISNNLELVDGDGRNDSSKAVDFFGTREPIREDDVLGTVEVEGSVEVEDGNDGNRDRKKRDGAFDVDTDIDMGF